MPPAESASSNAKPLAPQSGTRNMILAALPAGELELIRPLLFRVSLVMSQVVFEQGTPLDAVYFVEQGMIALVADVGGGESIQIAMTGCEGVRGATLLVQPDMVAAYQSVVEVAGSAYRMQAADFRRVAAQAPVFRALCLDYLWTFVRQIGQTAACNGRHDLPRRLCRLLLMVHDRAGSDDILLTQGQIARMIGVRRAGVSTVMAGLQNDGLLRQSRGRVTLLDREALTHHACECYARMKVR